MEYSLIEAVIVEIAPNYAFTRISLLTLKPTHFSLKKAFRFRNQSEFSGGKTGIYTGVSRVWVIKKFVEKQVSIV